VDDFRCTRDACNGAGTCVATRIPDNQACPGEAGQVCCGGQNVCFNVQTDNANCGSCGTSCAALPGSKTCTNGSCCEQCEDDPAGSLCCGSQKCVMRMVGEDPTFKCE
jgi:hypothetical protein